MLYPKIDNLFERDKNTFKLIDGKYKNEALSLINEWEWTEKVDGTNIRIEYAHMPIQGLVQKVGGIIIGGRTHKSDIPDGVKDYLQPHLDHDKFEGIFGDKSVMIFGEGYGPKIQACGLKYSDTQKFIVFDIRIDGHWLKRQDIEGICTKLGFEFVPYIGRMKVEDATNMVAKGFSSKIPNAFVQAEGLIGRTSVPLYDAKGNRLICKLKTVDFN